MSISNPLKERSQSQCELCAVLPASIEYTVSPKPDTIDNQVAICQACMEDIDSLGNVDHWRCLEGSIWNPTPSVQALSYRLLHRLQEHDWAANALASVDLDEDVQSWAMSALAEPEYHQDAYGNKLESGDNVVLTQSLNVKGTNFSAAKGTVVKNIKLVHDNIAQIEGKINNQTIVILSQYVKKG